MGPPDVGSETKEREEDGMRYGWSANEENFTGDFETREEALAEAKRENPEHTTLWTGERHPKSAADFVNVGSLLEDMQVAADDEAGEAAEDWLPGWNKEKDKQDALKAIIAQFVDATWPCRFWVVEKIEAHEVTP